MMRRKEGHRLSVKPERLCSWYGRQWHYRYLLSVYEIAPNLLAEHPAIHIDVCNSR